MEGPVADQTALKSRFINNHSRRNESEGDGPNSDSARTSAQCHRCGLDCGGVLTGCATSRMSATVVEARTRRGEILHQTASDRRLLDVVAAKSYRMLEAFLELDVGGRGKVSLTDFDIALRGCAVVLGQDDCRRLFSSFCSVDEDLLDYRKFCGTISARYEELLDTLDSREQSRVRNERQCDAAVERKIFDQVFDAGSGDRLQKAFLAAEIEGSAGKVN